MFGKNSKLVKFSIEIAWLFVGLFLFFTLIHITNPIIFPHTYSYENIILRTAEPIEKSMAQAVLSDSYDRITQSTLYEKDQVYNVHYPNSSFTKLIRFDAINSTLKGVNGLKNLLFASEFPNSSKILGYVHAADHYLNSYVSELNPYIIAHEITHLMSKDSQLTTYHHFVLNLSKNALEEGYAQLIATPEFNDNPILGSLPASTVSLVQGGGEYYIYNDDFASDKYGYASQWIVYNLIKDRDFSEIMRDPRNSDEIISDFLYNYLIENGYKKIDGSSTPGVIEGTWKSITP